MIELEMFNNLLSRDPTPGEKNRITREGNIYHVPGWVFGEENEKCVSYKRIKSRLINKYNVTGQILYDILMLGLTDINQRPVCQICGKPVLYDSFHLGYNTTCKSPKCKSECARREVLNLWKDENYRNIQSNSHIEWASKEENKEQMRQTSLNMWKDENYRKIQSDSHIKWASKEENKEQMRQTSLNMWKDENYRKKMMSRSTTSTHGSINCSKSKKADLVYDSIWERDFISFCEKSTNIISIERVEFYIEYLDENNKSRLYIPDFLISTDNGRTLLVEIKGKIYYEQERTKLKINAGYKYVSENDNIDDYILLLGEDIYTNKSYNVVDDNKLLKKLGII